MEICLVERSVLLISVLYELDLGFRQVPGGPGCPIAQPVGQT